MLRFILFSMVCLPLAWAQPTPATPTATSSSSSTSGSTFGDHLIDKIMGIAGPTEPGKLTERERFHLYAFSMVGPVPVLAEAVGAGLSQWQNDPKEWGQGWKAYGKRFDTNLAYNGVRQTITYGLSAGFHEDNRYFSSQRHGIMARTGYALLSTVTAKHPDGKRVFSVSAVAGIAGASAVSDVWEPPSRSGADGIARNAGISFATTAAFNVVREFLPDILHRRKK